MARTTDTTAASTTFDSRETIQVEEQPSQRGGQQRAEWLAFVRLDNDRVVALARRHPLHFVEQYRLAHPSEAGQEQALLRPPALHPPEEHLGLLEDRIPADQLGRRGAGPRRERIGERVHFYRFLHEYSGISLYFAILSRPVG
jgi:hypothetical protein